MKKKRDDYSQLVNLLTINPRIDSSSFILVALWYYSEHKENWSSCVDLPKEK